MNALEKELLKEKQRTEKLLKNISENLKTIKPDEALIKVIASGNSLQLYIKESEKDGMYGRYLSISEIDRAKNIVKSEYYNRLKAALEKRIGYIDRTIENLNKTNPFEIYKKMGKGKQRIIEPIEITTEQYREKWESVEYEGKAFGEDTACIYTDKGERVRSKSEKIIADKLYKENIAYRYEYPINIPYIGTLYPDFTILDEVNRRNIIYEHFGLMDNEDYANNAISKMQLYEREGYVLGDNFFCTMETSSKPLDSRMLDGIIGRIKGD